ncbi:MAG: contractile injection system protein, VgrG/Pvc8 family [Proteobacteria bacterium]|nr:contractile injection system protein, VgrG/Pvc8 family [Pseudomonadota bacterium]
MAENSVSQTAIYRARPTIRLDGQEDARVNELITGLKIDESEGGMSSLEMTLTNWASTREGSAEVGFPPGSKLALGVEIKVYAGDETQPRELFRGKISALEGVFHADKPPEITVLAEDALVGSRRARRSKVYSSMTPAAVARQIASNLNLSPVINGMDSPTDVWMQLNESDLAFLRRLVGRFDGDVQVVGNELHVSPRGDVSRGNLELALHSQLVSARVTIDLADQVTGVSTRGWDSANGSAVQADITSGAHLGPGSGKLGSQVLRTVFGERKEHLGHLAVHGDTEARALAQAAFDLKARRFVRVHGMAEGNAQLRVGTNLKLTGMGVQFDNTYYVVNACHVYDLDHGYRTEFGAECAYLGS